MTAGRVAVLCVVLMTGGGLVALGGGVAAVQVGGGALGVIVVTAGLVVLLAAVALAVRLVDNTPVNPASPPAGIVPTPRRPDLAALGSGPSITVEIEERRIRVAGITTGSQAGDIVEEFRALSPHRPLTGRTATTRRAVDRGQS